MEKKRREHIQPGAGQRPEEAGALGNKSGPRAVPEPGIRPGIRVSPKAGKAPDKRMRPKERTDRAKKKAAEAYKGLLQLLFPLRCPVCDDIVRPSGEKICLECLGSYSFKLYCKRL